MTIIDDVNSGKYNFVILCVVAILFFHIYWNKNNESMADVGNLDQIKEAIKQVYIADVEAIRNLSNVATQLQAGGLTIPGNLTVKGSFNIIPKGTIVAYNSDKAPEGWVLCDGKSNGAPDLRGRFIRMWNDNQDGFDGNGARLLGTENMGTYNEAWKGHHRDNGNGYMLKHKFGSFAGTDLQALHVGELPSHSHGCSIGESGEDRKVQSNSGTQYDEPGHSTNGGGYWGKRFNHNHGCSIANTGNGWAHSNQPPYWVLTYIMKI